MLSVIGEIEGHECLSSNTKTTKYEHVLPKLAEIEDSDQVDGVLVLLNTVGGDVESGLAIAEMLSSLSKPTVSLVLGGSHSIGVPLAVSTDYSFIVPSGTMVIHPVRMSGTVIGAPPTYDYFQQMQNRIIHFIASHSRADEKRLEQLMMNTTMLTKDLGTILVGADAVKEGLTNVAMQIAALSPKYVSTADVSEEYKAHEKEILMAQIQNDPKESQKPEKVIQGMITGRIKKELKEICLLDQVYVKAEDGKQTVAKYVEEVAKANGAKITIKGFVRFETGEGIEKRQDDFAAEVAAQVAGK